MKLSYVQANFFTVPKLRQAFHHFRAEHITCITKKKQFNWHVCSLGLKLDPSGEGRRATPAKEIVPNQGDAREAGQRAAKSTRTQWKMRLITWGSMSLVSDIKLIRTDTTLDLSHMAEKGIHPQSQAALLVPSICLQRRHNVWDKLTPPQLLLLSKENFPIDWSYVIDSLIFCPTLGEWHSVMRVAHATDTKIHHMNIKALEEGTERNDVI